MSQWTEWLRRLVQSPGSLPGHEVLKQSGKGEVIRARIEPFNLVLPATASGQYQNRNIVALLTNLVYDLESGHTWQAQIDNSHIGRILLYQVKSFITAIGTIHRKSLCFQTRDDLLLDIDIIFYDDRSH
jgi:hypothetical protein